ncbi:NgoFVII family restriction endonuclease, partial [bacterium]|nr:NgoFVII family restriction endonuclease [bacterium]
MTEPTYIIDNSPGNLLADYLCEELSHAKHARFAVGYLYLSGLQKLKDQLAHLDKLELVIGAQTDQETKQGLKFAHSDQQLMTPDQSQESADELSASIATQLNTEEPEGELRTTLNLLKQMKQEGRLEVRMYTKGRLHAKAYLLLQQRDERAVVGSSNLTASGFVNNRELNTITKNELEVKELKSWFDQLWEESDDFDEELFQVIEHSPMMMKPLTPYEMYLRICFEMVGDQLDENAERNVRRLEGGIFDKLAEFQRMAMLQAILNCREYGGTLIADVVGLGKTYIGLGLLRFFQEFEDKIPLVICPAGLKKMWEEKFAEYGIRGSVVSMGMLSKDGLPDELKGGNEWAEVVLIDESHNFRNSGTKRYELLTEQFLADPNADSSFGGGRRKRFIIQLSATPYNNQLPDIYNQLRMFIPEVEPPGGAREELAKLEDFFPKPVMEPAEDATPEEKKKRQEYLEIIEKTKELLGHVMIRRLRVHVQKYYSGATINGKPLEFPKRELENIRYHLDSSEGHEELYRDVVGLIPRDGNSVDKLTFARYSLASYLKPEVEEKTVYEGLNKVGDSLRGLMRVNLYKRLESSIFALRKTLKRQVRGHEIFLDGLNNGFILSGEILSNAIYEEDADLDTLMEKEKYAEQLQKYPVEGFRQEELEQDISNDLRILRSLNAQAEQLDDDEDPKLARLEELIREAQQKNEKLLIFSEFADTVDGLYRHFTNRPGHDGLGRCTSATKNVGDVLRRFAPKANNQPAPDKPIEILFASDVLSEGLNLQDCNQVINFDLHWNPVRLIQRLGRIERIGTEHSTIYAKNFLTVLGGEEGFKLVDILRHRIEEMKRVLGMTNRVLTEQDMFNDKAVYAIYDERDMEQLQNMEGSIMGFTLPSEQATGELQRLRREKPDIYKRIKELPTGVRS